MPTLGDLLNRFQPRPGGNADMFQVSKIHDAIRQAYDLGIVTASKKGIPETKSRAELIGHMLDEILDDLEDKDLTNEFILSLNEQFTEKGTLSPKQFAALENFYERIG